MLISSHTQVVCCPLTCWCYPLVIQSSSACPLYRPIVSLARPGPPTSSRALHSLHPQRTERNSLHSPNVENYKRRDLMIPSRCILIVFIPLNHCPLHFLLCSEVASLSMNLLSLITSERATLTIILLE